MGWLFSLSRVTDVSDQIYANNTAVIQSVAEILQDSLYPWPGPKQNSSCVLIPKTKWDICLSNNDFTKVRLLFLPHADGAERAQLIRLVNATGPNAVPTCDGYVVRALRSRLFTC